MAELLRQLALEAAHARGHRILHRDVEPSNPPVIAMTANAMADDHDKLIAAGMDDYISKPIDVAAMFATLARRVRSPSPT